MNLLFFSFIAGFITISSPCILSIAPILLATGINQNYYKPLGIITGLILSFSFFTLTMATIVKATGISPDIFRYVALFIIIFFGLTMIIPFFEAMLTKALQRIVQWGSFLEYYATTFKIDFISGCIIGIGLGLVWTPCAGPILATVTAVAATGETTAVTILMILSYAMGAGLPLFLFCIAGTKILGSMPNIMHYAHYIRTFFGVIIIATALAILFHADIIIQEKFAHLFPTLTFEQSDIVQKELGMLKKPLPDEHAIKEKAPALIGISEWLNSEPLTLDQLQGSVILLDFWTYTCINCIRTFPYIKQWYNTYKPYGFEIIGIHTPEFAFEKNKEHVEKAVKRFEITYPVALDNDYETWRAYDNHYWPAHYLIDQEGFIVKKQFGEGDYDEMENAIRMLLQLPPLETVAESSMQKPITPETYLGFERADRYHPSLTIQKNKPIIYETKTNLSENQIGLHGSWIIKPECVESIENNNQLLLNFIANRVYLVMQSDRPQQLKILLDEKSVPEKYRTRDMDSEGMIMVHEPRMYEILNLKDDYARHTLTLQCPKGVHAYVFTFGGEE